MVNGRITREALLDGLATAAQSFDEGELPYLALTSKPEHAIRDRWAWALARDGYRVAREWRSRCDLAVLGADGNAEAAVELKASYTHDVRWGMKPELRRLQAILGGSTPLEVKLRSDAEKVLSAAGTGDAYLLLISLHRADRVPPDLVELVSEGKRPPRDRVAAESTLLSYLAALAAPCSAVELGNGRAFGVGMTVTSWLCGPLDSAAAWRQRPSPLNS